MSDPLELELVDCELLCEHWGTELGSSSREEFLTILNVFLTAELSLKLQDFFFKDVWS